MLPCITCSLANVCTFRELKWVLTLSMSEHVKVIGRALPIYFSNI